MRNILFKLILILSPLVTIGQTEDPCYSVDDVFSLIEYENPAIEIDLLSGWNMIGYPCSQTIDLAEAFSYVVNNMIIVKNNNGDVYLPEFDFNGIGFLVPGEGYQIKMSNIEFGFSFCESINWPYLEGCTDCDATNFNQWANIDNGSCQYTICVDPLADNYQEVLPCIYYGCNDILALNYDQYATIDDGSCILLEACPYDIYVEYSADAQSYNVDLCQTLIVYGCTDFIAENYNLAANTNDSSCVYIFGCTDGNADNYNDYATQDDSSCIYLGCMDGIADNYNPQANQEDGSCIYYGCLNPTADNYDPQANEDDESCIIYGCTLVEFPNFNSASTIDDNSCNMNSEDVFGCTDSIGNNYNELATIDNGSCDFSLQVGDLVEGGIVFYIDETGEHGLVAAMEDLEGAYQWGCYEIGVHLADGTSIGSGLQNTEDIVNQGCITENGGITAAQAALDAEINGYSDWYLPSKDELYEMYNTIGNGGPEGNIGGFETSDLPYYWSSSEYNSDNAWRVYFGDGNTNNLSKYFTIRVRVIRAF